MKTNENSISDPEDYISITDEFQVNTKEKIGSGSFGKIYKCINTKTKAAYAAKIESSSTPTPQLHHEYQILETLQRAPGIPRAYLYKQNSVDNILIMDLLGPNLDDIMLDTKAKKFSIKTVSLIGIQIITRLSNLHELGFVHRDLKPENFCVGVHIRDGTVYLIDFGLSKKFRDSKGDHINFKEGRNLIGTIRFISINTHKGFEQSRRDDLESLFYNLVYFAKGNLPWEGVKAKTKEEKHSKIMEMKEACVKDETIFADLPDEFKLLFEHANSLEFTEKPNYFYLGALLNKIVEREKKGQEPQFDWMDIELLEQPVFLIPEIKKKKYLKAKEEKEMEMKNKQEEENDKVHEMLPSYKNKDKSKSTKKVLVSPNSSSNNSLSHSQTITRRRNTFNKKSPPKGVFEVPAKKNGLRSSMNLKK